MKKFIKHRIKKLKTKKTCCILGLFSLISCFVIYKVFCTSVWHEYYEVIQNQNALENMLEKITTAESIHERYRLANEAKNFANLNSTGYLSSDLIENFYLQIAKQHSIPLSEKFEPNSTLHVASTLYLTGGHSRVIEKWIENSPNNEKHSVYLTRDSVIPERLFQAVKEKNGQIYIQNHTTNQQISYKTALLNALNLRKISSNYERIILHIHMDDEIPLLAFGTEEFKRPIFLFNHADHRFWLGVSIADCIISFREYGMNLILKNRGGKENCILPLPLDKKIITHTKSHQQNLRRTLGLPQDKKIIFSSGDAKKFIPIYGYDFSDFIQKVSKKRDDIFFLIIGPTNLHTALPKNKLLVLPSMPQEAYKQYLSTADLVIDSFPMSGATALIDAISMGIPVLSLEVPTGQADYIVYSSIYLKSIDALMDKLFFILDHPGMENKILEELTEKMNKEMDTNNWLKLRNQIFKKYQKHSLHPFKSIRRNYLDLDSLDLYLLK